MKCLECCNRFDAMLLMYGIPVTLGFKQFSKTWVLENKDCIQLHIWLTKGIHVDNRITGNKYVAQMDSCGEIPRVLNLVVPHIWTDLRTNDIVLRPCALLYIDKAQCFCLICWGYGTNLDINECFLLLQEYYWGYYKLWIIKVHLPRW